MFRGLASAWRKLRVIRMWNEWSTKSTISGIERRTTRCGGSVVRAGLIESAIRTHLPGTPPDVTGTAADMGGGVMGVVGASCPAIDADTPVRGPPGSLACWVTKRGTWNTGAGSLETESEKAERHERERQQERERADRQRIEERERAERERKHERQQDDQRREQERQQRSRERTSQDDSDD